jgi:hypothetical protein
VGSIEQSAPSFTRRYIAARRLLVGSAVAFVILWSSLWVPVLLTGAQGSLFLFPVVFLLAVAPWGGACTALVLAARSRNEGCDSHSEVVVALSALLLALGPILLWFGPVAT